MEIKLKPSNLLAITDDYSGTIKLNSIMFVLLSKRDTQEATGFIGNVVRMRGGRGTNYTKLV